MVRGCLYIFNLHIYSLQLLIFSGDIVPSKICLTHHLLIFSYSCILWKQGEYCALKLSFHVANCRYIEDDVCQ